MESTRFSEHSKTPPTQAAIVSGLMTTLQEDNDFKEYASLNFLSQQLQWLSQEQATLCCAFIQREYEKITIAKKERSDHVDHFFLRNFTNHTILWKFGDEKLTLILQFLLQYKTIDLWTEYAYKKEVQVFALLQNMTQDQMSSLLLLDEKSLNNLIVLIQFHVQVIQFVIENIQSITNEHIHYLDTITRLCSKREDWYTDTIIAIFWLLFLRQEIDIDKHIVSIFTSITPQFLCDIYNEDQETDVEWVDENYYKKQLGRMQHGFLEGKLDKDDFLKRLKGNYLQEKTFRAGPVRWWR